MFLNIIVKIIKEKKREKEGERKGGGGGGGWGGGGVGGGQVGSSVTWSHGCHVSETTASLLPPHVKPEADRKLLNVTLNNMTSRVPRWRA